MAAETKPIACAAGQYTAISAGHEYVSFKPELVYGGRMAFAASQPAADTNDYRNVEGGEPVSLGGMTGRNVYWKPNAPDGETIRVARA